MDRPHGFRIVPLPCESCSGLAQMNSCEHPLPRRVLHASHMTAWRQVPSGGMQIVEFRPETASPEDWAQYHAFRRARHQEDDPEEPLEPDELAQANMRRPDPFQERRWFLVKEGDAIVGSLGASGSTPENPEFETWGHLLWAHVWVLEPYRRRGIGKRVVSKLLEVMDERGASVLSLGTRQESGHAYLQWLGAEPKYTEVASRLDLRQIDWEMVDRWVREGAERSPESTFRLYAQRVPDELMDSYTAAQTRLLNTMPWEDMEHGKIVETADKMREWYARLDRYGASHHLCLVQDPDGSMVAMTDVIKYPHETGFVRQYFTGVDPKARGRGLGKWVKAATLQHIRQVHPKTIYVTTENAGSNDAMLGINRKLGFHPWKQNTTYQVAREALVSGAPAARSS
jgi:mycothiol synthase